MTFVPGFVPMRFRLLPVLAIITTFLLIGASALSLAGSEAGGAAAPALKASLRAINGTFEPEAWKYDLDYAGNAFGTEDDRTTHIQNVSSSYFSAMGYRVSFLVAIVDEDGSPVSEDVDIAAKIDTPQGPLRPFVKANDAQGAVNEYYIDFDVDGSIAGGPEGRNLPPLLPGFHVLLVEVFEAGSSPTSDPISRGISTIGFEYVRPTMQVDVTFARPAVTRLPDPMFRLFNDLGYGADVAALDRPISQARTVEFTVNFGGLAGLPVDLTAFIARRVDSGNASAPSGSTNPPHVPGVTDDPGVQNALGAADSVVEVQRIPIFEAVVTDAAGTVYFTVPLPTVTNRSNLILFAASLNLTALQPALDSSKRARVGASEFLVPVSMQQQVDAPLLVDAFTVQATGGGAGPFSEGTQLQVRIFNPTSQSGLDGDVYAYVASPFGSRLLTSGDMSPDPDPARSGRYTTGSFPVAPIREQPLTWYRVMSVLYGANDVFYSLAYADRGYEIEASAPLATVGKTGTLFVNLTSVTTNYNAEADESGFRLDVMLGVLNQDLGLNDTRSVALLEAGRTRLTFPIASAGAGNYPVEISAASVDTVAPTLERTVRFSSESDDSGPFGFIPGFELVVAILALAGAFVWRRARRD